MLPLYGFGCYPAKAEFKTLPKIIRNPIVFT